MPGRNRDINHWAPQPSFTASLQIGVEFCSTEVTSPMWRFVSFYGVCGELESPAADYSLDSFLCSHNAQQTLFLFTDEILSCFAEITVRKPGMERRQPEYIFLPIFLLSTGSLACLPPLKMPSPSSSFLQQREPSYTVGGHANWHSHYGEHCGGSLKKLKIELPYEPALPLPGVYLGKTTDQKDDMYPNVQSSTIYNS